MTRTEWNAEYLRLENAETDARIAYRRACGAEKKADAMHALRIAGKARWDFEMANCRIVDIATLPTAAWAAAMLPR